MTTEQGQKPVSIDDVSKASFGVDAELMTLKFSEDRISGYRGSDEAFEHAARIRAGSDVFYGVLGRFTGETPIMQLPEKERRQVLEALTPVTEAAAYVRKHYFIMGDFFEDSL